MPAISGRKICRQFRVGRYASNFGLENMPAFSGRKKKMPAMSNRKKMSANSGRKKMPFFRAGIKLPENWQLPENLQVCLPFISSSHQVDCAGKNVQLTDLIILIKSLVSHIFCKTGDASKHLWSNNTLIESLKFKLLDFVSYLCDFFLRSGLRLNSAIPLNSTGS